MERVYGLDHDALVDALVRCNIIQNPYMDRISIMDGYGYYDFMEDDELRKEILNRLAGFTCEQIDRVFGVEKADEDDEDDYYEEDYGPSNPWDAPGMKISDFVSGVVTWR